MIQRTLAVLAIVLASTATTLGQSMGIVQGTIRDPLIQRAAFPVAVQIDDGTVVRETKTDRHGAFVFLGIPGGPAKLTIVVGGYHQVTIATCVVPNQIRRLQLYAPEPIALPRVYGIQSIPQRYVDHDRENALSPLFTQTNDQYSIGSC